VVPRSARDFVNTKGSSNVIGIDERIVHHLTQILRASVEETLNALLDAKADRLCRAGRYERTAAEQDTRVG
jgi:16S rRNA U1498 N3-methylase RsmE